MGKYKMVAECMPKNNINWFTDFAEEAEFQASNIEEAQKALDALCEEAGTNKDAYYDLYGPTAVRKENK